MEILDEILKPFIAVEHTCCCAGKKEVENGIPIPRGTDDSSEVLPGHLQIDIEEFESWLKATVRRNEIPPGANEHVMAVLPPPILRGNSISPSAPLAASPAPPRPAANCGEQPDEYYTQAGNGHEPRSLSRESKRSSLSSRSGSRKASSPTCQVSGSCTASATASAIETAQLQSLVNIFAHDAVRGRPCKFVNSDLECVDAKYRLDSSLQYLLIFTARNKKAVEVQCNIGRIQDIHTYEEDGPSCFHPEILQQAGRVDALQNLLLVTYLDRQGDTVSFCMVESSHEGRDAFLQSMRVLGLYAQQSVLLHPVASGIFR